VRPLPILRLATACLLLAGACRGKRSPQDRVRGELAALEAAVEQKHLDRVREGMSPAFVGPDGLDRAGLMAMLQVRLRTRPELYLLTRIEELELVEPGLVRAEVLVAMAAVQMEGPEVLSQVEADLLRVRLRLREEAGRFRVIAASWEPVPIDAFL
jgi:hypothetical protein